jgi:hypothetical protein
MKIENIAKSSIVVGSLVGAAANGFQLGYSLENVAHKRAEQDRAA